jgi:hypothetical protein
MNIDDQVRIEHRIITKDGRAQVTTARATGFTTRKVRNQIRSYLDSVHCIAAMSDCVTMEVRFPP